MEYGEFLSITENRKFAVFGTGFVAEMFYQGLLSRGCADNIDRFYVSGTPENDSFHGIPVCSLRAYRGDLSLLAAVHAANLESIDLPKENAVFIYPFLREYLYGKPVRENVRIRLKDLLAAQPEDENWIAVRYAGIDGLEKNDDSLTALYIRAISMHCSEATARKRLTALQAMCASIRTGGFDSETAPIAIDENYRIIDGLHRTAAAAYFGIPEISCDLYAASPVYDRVLTERNRLPAAELAAAGFTVDELAKIRHYRRILQHYE